MLNQDIRKILDPQRLNEAIAHNLNTTMFKNITDDEWNVILEHKGTMVAIILQKIQDEIYSYFALDLLQKLHLSSKANKDVDASIYGGLLEGVYNASYRTICEEARKRQENRERKNLRDQKKL